MDIQLLYTETLQTAELHFVSSPAAGRSVQRELPAPGSAARLSADPPSNGPSWWPVQQCHQWGGWQKNQNRAEKKCGIWVLAYVCRFLPMGLDVQFCSTSLIHAMLSRELFFASFIPLQNPSPRASRFVRWTSCMHQLVWRSLSKTSDLSSNKRCFSD